MRYLYFILVLFFSFPSLFAQEGGPPMLTDDAQVADFKEWELNISFNTLITQDFTFIANEKQLSIPHIDLNYGLLPNLQLKIEAPLLLTMDPFSVPRVRGESKLSIGEVGAGVKYRFLDEEKHFVSAATFPQYFFNGDNGFLIPVFFEKKIKNFLAGIGYGYFIRENIGGYRNNYQEFGMLAGYTPTKSWSLMLEYFIRDEIHPSAPNETSGYVNAGFRKVLNETYMIMGSAGTQVVTPTGTPREYFISWLGIKILF